MSIRWRRFRFERNDVWWTCVGPLLLTVEHALLGGYPFHWNVSLRDDWYRRFSPLLRFTSIASTPFMSGSAKDVNDAKKQAETAVKYLSDEVVDALTGKPGEEQGTPPRFTKEYYT